ncbi:MULTISPECIES: class I SAM-dependent methyltransferase [unclassified Thermoactinomyces]|jgi:ubiquinone/menaquinone biosynthesis C-methylase UbiE|uniref:class I SAM-dependent methyltransferase n=1 Tax=unclassified Thermoactinomyces TaxID=2634588 RepID=UPI0018DB03FF|nr:MULTISPECIES: class I SAM-dependent methyltransferase [unclassified Thermoactinomyces]MBH8599727.1 class I SAM-dependent methyltransferase [Thermoactinomyces sp. CICC 10523]MBH8609315.1 class I SAM-dependent methyltransferase [Thermoactinomyces sp. CICC 10521]
MKVTDYSRIADRYDQNPYRRQIGPDENLKRYFAQHPDREFRVLDLACGTGLYLQKQLHAFASVSVEWYGLDASQAMLNQAKRRVPNVRLIQGLAEEMPYEPESFDVIVNHYAFHHFAEKSRVLDEVTRILKKNGMYKMHNISIHEMRQWWVYQYFPSAYFEDLKRFWPKDLIYRELSVRGFQVELDIRYRMTSMPLTECMQHARNRDISVLTLIDEKDYQAGVERLETELNRDSEASIINDFAELHLIAVK